MEKNKIKQASKIRNVLVTGGAGFVASHVVDRLLQKGYRVRVFDNLEPQVHGKGRKLPYYLNRKAQFVRGNVLALKNVQAVLEGMDAVLHLAAVVGVGQSMYEIKRYMECNVIGTAILLEEAVKRRQRLKKIVIASSMSNYGEGAYRCPECGGVAPPLRSIGQMQKRKWEVKCPECGKIVLPLPTPETKPLQPNSIYAIAKRDQEEMGLLIGKTYQLPVVALRYFNIYGPRQALSNPYTGVAAIFSSRLINQQPPLIFEDGRQSRDFIHVHDVARANVLALEAGSAADYEVFNVGTGRSLNLLQMAEVLGGLLGSRLKPEIVYKFREGDIRHCYADTRKAEKILGFKAAIPFEKGMKDLVAWLRTQKASDKVRHAARELEQRGLLK